MRRATLRMTLESSTTRHVFISASTSTSRRDVSIPGSRLQAAIRSGTISRTRSTSRTTMSWPSRRWTPPASLAMRGIEIDGVFLAAVVGELQHLADLVDQQAVGLRRADRRRPPSAACRRRSCGRPSRARMSITVTMRPRRLSTPAISADDSGTRVSRSGMNTSCTREIGRPNSWPPIIGGDVFGRRCPRWCRSWLSCWLMPSACSCRLPASSAVCSFSAAIRPGRSNLAT